MSGQILLLTMQLWFIDMIYQTFEQFVEALKASGWKNTGDAQHENLEKVWANIENDRLKEWHAGYDIGFNH